MNKLIGFIVFAYFIGATQAVSASTVNFTATQTGSQVSVLLSGSGFDAAGGYTGTGVGGTPLDFSWNPNILNFNSVTFATGWDNPANPLGFSFPGTADNVAGTLTGFAAGNTSANLISSANFDIATLVFDVASVGTSAFSYNFVTGNPWFQANLFTPIDSTQVTLNTGSITTVSAVPLPPAVLLFGSSLLGLLGVNGRRKA